MIQDNIYECAFIYEFADTRADEDIDTSKR